MAESPHKYLLMANPGAILTLKRYLMFIVVLVKLYTVTVFLVIYNHYLTAKFNMFKNSYAEKKGSKCHFLN